MAINPCCMPLQRGVTIMAVIDIVFATVDLILAIVLLLFLTVWKDEWRKNNNDVSDSAINVAIAIACVVIIISILGLLLSLRLYFGAKKRDIRNCRIWLIIKLILFCLDLLSLIVNSSTGDEATYSLAVTIIILLYRIYMMYCVYCFIQEMKMDASRLGFQARLEGGAAYQMHDYPPNPHQQPTVFVNSNTNHTPQYPPPYSGTPYPQQPPPQNQQYPGSGGTGLGNPNHQYYNTNN